MVELLLIR